MILLLVLGVLQGGSTAWARPSGVPVCPAYTLKTDNGGDPGDIPGGNNAQVLSWKTSTRNQFQARAHVRGRTVRVYPDRNGHQHFAIQIGAGDTDTVEIVYNQDFGPVPTPAVGMPVDACGDYITSYAAAPGPEGEVYPASPDGALVHWVHQAPARSAHNSGFLLEGSQLIGPDTFMDTFTDPLTDTHMELWDL